MTAEFTNPRDNHKHTSGNHLCEQFSLGDPQWLTKETQTLLETERRKLIKDLQTQTPQEVTTQKSEQSGIPVVTVDTPGLAQKTPLASVLEKYAATPLSPRISPTDTTTAGSSESIRFDTIAVPRYRAANVNKLQTKNKRSTNPSYVLTLTNALDRAGFDIKTPLKQHTMDGVIRLTATDGLFARPQVTTGILPRNSASSAKVQQIVEAISHYCESLTPDTRAAPPKIHTTIDSSKLPQVASAFHSLPVVITQIKPSSESIGQNTRLHITLRAQKQYTTVNSGADIRQKGSTRVITISDAVRTASIPSETQETYIGIHARPGEILLTEATERPTSTSNTCQ